MGCCESYLYDTTLESKNRTQIKRFPQVKIADPSHDLLLKNTLALPSTQRAIVTYKRSQARAQAQSIFEQNIDDEQKYSNSSNVTLTNTQRRVHAREGSDARTLTVSQDEDHFKSMSQDQQEVDEALDKEGHDLIEALTQSKRDERNSMNFHTAQGSLVESQELFKKKEVKVNRDIQVIESIEIIKIESVIMKCQSDPELSKEIQDFNEEQKLIICAIQIQHLAILPIRLAIAYNDQTIRIVEILTNLCLKEVSKVTLKDSVIVMEQLAHSGVEPIIILALDMTNTFYMINSQNGDIILMNDNASKLQTSFGTYCELLKCLEIFNMEYFVTARWNSDSNLIEVRSVSTLDIQLSIPVSQHVNEILEVKDKDSSFYGCIIVGLSDGYINILKISENLREYQIIAVFQADDFGMSIYSISEIRHSRICIACYENIYVWDLEQEILVNKMTNCEDNIKKLITLSDENNLESEIIASVDEQGLLNIWDGENIRTAQDQTILQQPKLRLQLAPTTIGEAQGSINDFNELIGNNKLEVKDIIQLNKDQLLVVTNSSLRLITMTYTLKSVAIL